MAIVMVAATVTVGSQRASAVCTGDCSGSGNVTVAGIIVLVNIALGTAQPSACPDGIPAGESVNVALIVQAVNNALNGCSPVATPTPGGGGAVCGDGTVQPPEECDNGGTCIGGMNAGMHCTAESQCQGDGVCVDGPKWEFGCSSDADCPGSTCKHC